MIAKDSSSSSSTNHQHRRTQKVVVEENATNKVLFVWGNLHDGHVVGVKQYVTMCVCDGFETRRIALVLPYIRET